MKDLADGREESDPADRTTRGRTILPIPVRRSPAPALAAMVVLLIAGAGCLNPFAPGRDNSPAEATCDPRKVEGILQCFQAAYTFRDTTVYGPLIGQDFVFLYRNYDLGIDVSWGRDDEMRSTYGLFQNAQKLDLIWNGTIPPADDSTTMSVVLGFNLTVVFNPSDIEVVNGYASLSLSRARTVDPWKIVRWRDESQY